jgi:hypothetical protein
MTLLTSGATYNLATNGTIASINAASGVTGVTLSVSTQLAANGFTTAVGDGSIGAIDLPGGGSTVSVNDRGDLGSIQGPTTAGLSDASALDLVFMDLTGSLSGLDTIQAIQASGWLGTSASQVVNVNRGVGSLSAYGVGAAVNTDLYYSVTDAVMQVNVGYGGVPGIINAGNVRNTMIDGNVNDISIQDLEGNLDPPDDQLLVIKNAANEPAVTLGDVAALAFLNPNTTVQSIKARSIGLLYAKSNLTVTTGIAVTGGSVGAILIGGRLQAQDILVNGSVGFMDVLGTVSLSNPGNPFGGFGVMKVTKQVGIIAVGNPSANLANTFEGILQVNQGWTKTGWLSVNGGFSGAVLVIVGNLPLFRVAGNLTGISPTSAANLVIRDPGIADAAASYGVAVLIGDGPNPGRGQGELGSLQVTGNIGRNRANGQYMVLAAYSIGSVQTINGNIYSPIMAGVGGIQTVSAGNELAANVTALEGSIGTVTAKVLASGVTIQATVGGRDGSGKIDKILVGQLLDSGENVHFTADEGIGYIGVADPGQNVYFTVDTQGLGLVINVGTANFLGTVNFAPPDNAAPVEYKAYTGGYGYANVTKGSLLTLTAANVYNDSSEKWGGPLSWYILGPLPGLGPVVKETQIVSLIFKPFYGVVLPSRLLFSAQGFEIESDDPNLGPPA